MDGKETQMKSSLLTLLVSLLVLILSGCENVGSRGAEDVKVGSRAPVFSLKSLAGETVTSRSYEGSILIINFWASWCEPCKIEMPILKQLADSSEPKVVGIALDEGGLKAVKPFIEKYGINYTVLLGHQDVFNRFQGFGIPYTLVLDREQKIVSIYRGPVTREALEQDVKKIQQGL
jgi:cytochrome c biogenesis protein CcmG, thiol:disulfide interchange protein DsbE